MWDTSTAAGRSCSERCSTQPWEALPARSNTVSWLPASPPVPAGPGRFPGCRRAAEHSHHPAAASPALHPGVRRLPLRTDAGHGEWGSSHTTRANGTGAPPPVLLGTEQDPSVGDPSVGWSIPGEVPCGEALLLPRAVSSSPLSVPSHHGGFLGEAQPAAPGRSALQPSRHPHALPPAWGGKPGTAVPRGYPRGQDQEGLSTLGAALRDGGRCLRGSGLSRSLFSSLRPSMQSHS